MKKEKKVFMNREAIAKKMGELKGSTKKEMDEILDIFINVVEEAVTTCDGIDLKKGRNTFLKIEVMNVKEKEARIGHNPRNPEEKINIPFKPATKKIKATIGKTTQELVK